MSTNTLPPIDTANRSAPAPDAEVIIPMSLRKFQVNRFLPTLILPLMYALAVYVGIKRVLFRSLGWGKPRTNALFFDGLSEGGRRVRAGAARFGALDAVYNFVPRGNNGLVRLIDYTWLNIRNAQAVRNRLIIVEQELERAIREAHNKNPERAVRVLSIAAGAAQAVVEVAAKLRIENIQVRIVAADKDPSAIAYAIKMADRFGVADCFNIIIGDARHFTQYIEPDSRFDVVEMAGLLDYLNPHRAVSVMKLIKSVLAPGGEFVTCHIHNNIERYFLLIVIDWWMLYRSLSQLVALAQESGFASDQIRTRTEPQDIHTVMICRN